MVAAKSMGQTEHSSASPVKLPLAKCTIQQLLFISLASAGYRPKDAIHVCAIDREHPEREILLLSTLQAAQADIAQ